MKQVATICGLVAVLLLASVFALGDQQVEVETVQPPGFTGNVVVVYIMSEQRHPTYVVDKPRFRYIGDRLFLSGVGADTKRPADWRIGMDINVAWNLVTSFNVLTQEQFTKYVADENR
jgi:hypothetical protein